MPTPIGGGPPPPIEDGKSSAVLNLPNNDHPRNPEISNAGAILEPADVVDISSVQNSQSSSDFVTLEPLEVSTTIDLLA